MKFWYNPNFLAIFFLLLLAIPALKSLAQPGFYTSHDGETHTARIAQYWQALADGQIPPRFAKTFYNGIGSPIFIYIYPMPYLLGSFIHFLGFSFVDSFKLLMILTFTGSAIFAFLWLKEILESTKAGFLGALFYVWVPYRFSLLYVRASVSEMLAYTFLPFVLFALTKFIRTKSLKWASLGAISMGFLLLSQNLVAIISLGVIVVYALLLLIFAKQVREFFLVLSILVWGFLISSVTYLPSLFERNFVHFNEVIKDQFVHHFVTIRQLFYSPWGYGFDLVGTVNDEMSFQIGLAHILIILISIVLGVIFFVKRNNPRLIPLAFTDSVTSQDMVLLGFFFTVMVISVFMMTETKLALLIWQNLKLFQIIDIPWRLLGLVVLGSSFLAALVAKTVKSGFLFIILVFAVVIANRNHLRINQSVFYDDNHFINYKGTATQYSEFTPIWRQTISIPQNRGPIEVIEGNVNISNLILKSNKISFNVETVSSSQIKINRFYFPKTTVKISDLPTEYRVISPQDKLLNNKEDNTGLILFPLEKGKNRISVEFKETTLRLIANYLTLTSLVFAVVVFALNVKK